MTGVRAGDRSRFCMEAAAPHPRRPAETGGANSTAGRKELARFFRNSLVIIAVISVGAYGLSLLFAAPVLAFFTDKNSPVFELVLANFGWFALSLLLLCALASAALPKHVRSVSLHCFGRRQTGCGRVVLPNVSFYGCRHRMSAAADRRSGAVACRAGC